MEHGLYYPTKVNSVYYTIFSFLLIILMMMQIITGMLLFLFFDTNCEYSFSNLMLLMSNMNYAWFLKSFHEMNSNIMFSLMYLHIFKNLYYKSYTYNNYFKWISGFMLYMLMIAMCFLGYMLPWGQMSYWAATVMMNLLSMLPYGNNMVYFMWGGLNVNYFTLMSFSTLHFLLAMMLIIIIMLHIKIVHYNTTKSNLFFKNNTINYFYLYNFTIKDLFLLMSTMFMIVFFMCYYPEFFSNPVNFMPANSLETPKHMMPEWYLMWLYGILKLMPNKTMGILTMLSVFILLLLIPFMVKKKMNCYVITMMFLMLVDMGFYPMTNILYFILIYFLFLCILVYFMMNMFFKSQKIMLLYNKPVKLHFY